jgi:hypothetical protein
VPAPSQFPNGEQPANLGGSEPMPASRHPQITDGPLGNPSFREQRSNAGDVAAAEQRRQETRLIGFGHPSILTQICVYSRTSAGR